MIDGDDFYRGGDDAFWDACGPAAKAPARVVIFDGAYRARPELADLLALRVLLHVDRAVRRERLLRREGERARAEWEARWSEAEDLSFGVLMPPEAFDLVLDGTPHVKQ